MKTTRFSIRLTLIGLTLSSVAMPAAAQTAAGWRYESRDEPVIVGDAGAGSETITASDVGTFRRKSISAAPAAHVATQKPAVSAPATAVYRHQEGNPRPMPQAVPNPMPAQGDYSPGNGAWTDSCGHGGDCGSGCGNGCGGCGCGGWFFGGGRGSWVTGIEYLYARPHFSEPTAYILQTGPVTDPTTGDVSLTHRTVSYGYDYESSFRMYAAYQVCDCCAEVRLTYSRLESNDTASELSVVNSTPTFFEVQPLPGNTLTSTSDITGNVLDLDCARCIRLGDDDSCCDGCPAWDLQWSVGARLADWEYSKDVFTNVVTDGRIDVDMDFIGGGPKVGLEGRRYFGECNQFNVYSTLDIALVLGWFKHDLQRTIPPFGVSPETVELLQSRVTRLVPVTEIELGASWAVAPRWTISAGWFFAAWWDLGMGETQTSTIFGGNGPHFMLDDANIMSWDGLTAKVEFVW